MDPWVTLIAGVITAAIGASITFFLTRLYSGDPLIPGFDRDAKNAYAHLNRTWYSQHITFDHAKTASPYWQRGEVTLRVHSGGLVTGTQKDHNDARDTYDLRGKIRNGQLFLIARAQNDTFDAYLSHFLNLRRNNLLCGLWVGVNYEREPFCGAYILSDKELLQKELNETVSHYRVSAGLSAESVWRNDRHEN